MDPNSLAEELPALYRAILARVAELEAEGRRSEAAQVRMDATQIYSRAWDERARRRLEALVERSRRPVAGEGIRSRERGFLGRRSGSRSAVIS